MRYIINILLASGILAGVPAQGTFFLPISEHASDVIRILRADFDRIFLNDADVATTLNSANKEVNSLFE